MRSLRQFFIASVLAPLTVLASSHPATSGERACRNIQACAQPTSVATNAVAGCQLITPVQTCCQPVATSVQPKIELIAYARPAAPRRLAPQPDALEVNRTTSGIACAQYLAFDYGSLQLYYGVNCSNNSPTVIYGQNLGPLPGSCSNPNGACVTSGSAVVPTAFNKKTSSSQSVIQKSVRLAQKRKAGDEPNNSVDAQGVGAHKLKERTRVGQPIYVRLMQLGGGAEGVLVELQQYFVKGTGKASEELSGTFALGVEIDATPTGKAAKEINPQQIQIVADHVAQLTVGDVTYDIVTATKLVP